MNTADSNGRYTYKGIGDAFVGLIESGEFVSQDMFRSFVGEQERKGIFAIRALSRGNGRKAPKASKKPTTNSQTKKGKPKSSKPSPAPRVAKSPEQELSVLNFNKLLAFATDAIGTEAHVPFRNMAAISSASPEKRQLVNDVFMKIQGIYKTKALEVFPIESIEVTEAISRRTSRSKNPETKEQVLSSLVRKSSYSMLFADADIDPTKGKKSMARFFPVVTTWRSASQAEDTPAIASNNEEIQEQKEETGAQSKSSLTNERKPPSSTKKSKTKRKKKEKATDSVADGLSTETTVSESVTISEEKVTGSKGGGSYKLPYHFALTGKACLTFPKPRGNRPTQKAWPTLFSLTDEYVSDAHLKEGEWTRLVDSGGNFVDTLIKEFDSLRKDGRTSAITDYILRCPNVLVAISEFFQGKKNEGHESVSDLLDYTSKPGWISLGGKPFETAVKFRHDEDGSARMELQVCFPIDDQGIISVASTGKVSSTHKDLVLWPTTGSEILKNTSKTVFYTSQRTVLDLAPNTE